LKPRWPALLALAVLVGGGKVAVAESISFDRPEAWALKYFSSIAQSTFFGGPPLRAGAVEVVVEGGWVPSLSEAERRVGFNGTKVEDLNKTSLFGRLQFRLGLPRRWTATFGYVPPVELGGATPNIWSAALEHPVVEGRRWLVGARIHGLAGRVDGDFTCSREAVAAGSDPIRNPLGCEEISEDQVRLALIGLELTSRRVRHAGGPEIFATLGVNQLAPRFRVNARYGGISDRTRLSTEGMTGYATAGVNVPIRHAVRWSTEVYFAPLRIRRPGAEGVRTESMVNARMAVSLRLR
jgi:hypothetical protein